MSFSIKGTGSCYPEKVVTNEDLSKMVDTSDEWIYTRTGIKERRIATHETMSELSVTAAKRAVENAGIDPGEIDLVIFSTVHGEYNTPSMACVVSEGLGVDCPAFDLNGACSGFLYALDVADGFFARGKVRHILVVAAEMMSHIVDWEDRATCVLFGDGAGAAVLSAGDDLLAIKLRGKGNSEVLQIPNYIGNSPYTELERRPTTLYMNGREVYRFAVDAMSSGIKEVMEMADLSPEEITWVMPHQANARIIEGAKKRLEFKDEQYVTNIEHYANVSSACIPCLLDQMNRGGKLHAGDTIAMSAFGGGLTSAAAIVRWSI